MFILSLSISRDCSSTANSSKEIKKKTKFKCFLNIYEMIYPPSIIASLKFHSRRRRRELALESSKLQGPACAFSGHRCATFKSRAGSRQDRKPRKDIANAARFISVVSKTNRGFVEGEPVVSKSAARCTG